MDKVPLGAVKKSDGSVIVPESKRADGSVRKQIRIRAGYVPPDEQRKYRPRFRREREEKAAAAAAIINNSTKESKEEGNDDKKEEKELEESLEKLSIKSPKKKC